MKILFANDQDKPKTWNRVGENLIPITMYKLKKNISVLALILGLTLAITGSAFKQAVVGDLHAKIGGVWTDIPDNYTQGQDYTCVESGQCTARFELGENEVPSDENMIPSSLEDGTYQ